MDYFKKYYKIQPIETIEYKNRLDEEIKQLEKLGYIWFIKRVAEIYTTYVNKYPNLLRGSAGSSLLLYYMGINQIDPVKYSIPFVRFINMSRNTLPDIDIDVPSSIRSDLINDIINNNSDTIRMTSNHDNEDNIYFENLIKENPSSIYTHNSGIIVYSKEQENIIENNKLSPNQIKLTKNTIGNYGLKKIDILANTALEQLYFIHESNSNTFCNYDFKDEKIYKFILEDDGIGITYAETPTIQNVIKILEPSNIEELSICLALVRPFACDKITNNMTFQKLKNEIIYDDDFITFIKEKMNYTEEDADVIRRIFKTNVDKIKMENFLKIVDESNLSLEEKLKLRKVLSKLPKYSFCKAHSINHARLIYCLYWNKYYKTKKFWISAIKNIKGYYRDWVYIRKGLDNGLKFKGIEKCNSFYHFVYTGYWLNKDFMTRCYLKNISTITNSTLTNNNNNSICNYKINNEEYYEDNTIENIDEENIIENINEEQIKYNQEYEFRGLIAGLGNNSTKYNKSQTVITIGYDNNKFINLHLNKRKDLSKFKQVIGKGYMINSKMPYIVITKMILL
jgi:DNA polymerase III alpha subunit